MLSAEEEINFRFHHRQHRRFSGRKNTLSRDNSGTSLTQSIPDDIIFALKSQSKKFFSCRNHSVVDLKFEPL